MQKLLVFRLKKPKNNVAYYEDFLNHAAIIRIIF